MLLPLLSPKKKLELQMNNEYGLDFPALFIPLTYEAKF